MASLLLFDCTDSRLSVALQVGDQVYSQTQNQPRQQSLHLLPTIEQLLSQAGLTLEHLDAIACTCGPGSFTGIRIVVSAAQGLAYGVGCRLIPLSSLKALAFQSQVIKEPQLNSIQVIAMLDARMGGVYWASFRWHEGQLKRLTEDALAEVSDWQADLDASGIVLGSGAALVEFPDRWEIDSEMQIDVVTLLPWAQAQLAKGNSIAAEALKPVYCRGQEAWKKQDPAPA